MNALHFEAIQSIESRSELTADEPSVAWLQTLALSQSQPALLRRLTYLQLLKPALDVLVASLLGLLVLPLAVAIVVAIKLSMPGPILYRQTRIGRGGVPFTVYKFRTMVADRRVRAERIPFPDRRVRHKSATDPRVTRLGGLLRRSSLDELPQLLNVLRGEMSLVGPRPELPALVERYADWQHARHLVRPGITGWWQVNGRSARPMHEATELDIEYVERVSLWFDLRILARTARAVLSRHGAF
jgi:lipopolysaccharide/colanic/teichoic acid biosynthesis glycosyltransferase